MTCSTIHQFESNRCSTLEIYFSSVVQFLLLVLTFLELLLEFLY